MNAILETLIRYLDNSALLDASVIPWSSPVPTFGDLSRAKVASLGLNPSNREFVSGLGEELDGPLRRFHTLKSLGISDWSDANAYHLEKIATSCVGYFSGNPYDAWFRRLDRIISGTQYSYYDAWFKACHLDLIPYATSRKWMDLTNQERTLLLDVSGDCLGFLLRDSPVRVLVLNGRSVVEHFQDISGYVLERREIPEWTLPRESNGGVVGIGYKGVIQNLCGYNLERDLLVLGFNHNIQSSFGVTAQVISSIRDWVARSAERSIQ